MTQTDNDRFLAHLERSAKHLEEHAWHDVEVTDELKRMVMANCNVRGILESWNVRPVMSGRQWNGFCPDHVLHDGHAQHLPKWTMSAENGDCTCFTSGEHSNFIWVAKRMYGLDTVEETLQTLLNTDQIILPPPDFVADSRKLADSEQEEERKRRQLEKGCAMMRRLMERNHLGQECLEYFARDGIRKGTLEFLGVCSVEGGPFDGRAMIPFIGPDREVCGYVAVNYTGKDSWVKKAYEKARGIDSSVKMEDVEKQYKKTLYCPGFHSRNHMYGQYEVLEGGDNLDRLVIVEGERDAMKLLQEGIDCVSIHGTSLKREQLMSLKRMNPRRIYLGFDMDKAGCVATMKALDAMRGEFESVRVLNFPDGRDPKKFTGDEIMSLMSDADASGYDNVQEREEISEGE